VLVLTALDAKADVKRGLDLGADDYVSKPFDMGELVARCRALIRRSYGRPESVIAVGPLRIDASAHSVTFQGSAVRLTAMEYKILEYLALRAGQVVSKAEIIDHLYDFGSENLSNVVEVHVSSLRRRFDPGPDHRLIRTVRGLGYVLGEPPP
jgi:DNA-binding response OmpR family regulator